MEDGPTIVLEKESNQTAAQSADSVIEHEMSTFRDR
jgi:hypothetical protein